MFQSTPKFEYSEEMSNHPGDRISLTYAYGSSMFINSPNQSLSG
ncbi:hypothetical protein [Chlorogloeopsis fritschii]|nr:hypothetical protein [Chlorogloeopsis fritschii]